MDKLFYEGLVNNDLEKLQKVLKSDLHNHASKGCRKSWLEEQLGHELIASPTKFSGLEEMHDWFQTNLKPFCSGKDGLILRWEGAFIEAKRNHLERLAMSFGVQDIELVGGMEAFEKIIEEFKAKYCPNI